MKLIPNQELHRFSIDTYDASVNKSLAEHGRLTEAVAREQADRLRHSGIDINAERIVRDTLKDPRMDPGARKELTAVVRAARQTRRGPVLVSDLRPELRSLYDDCHPDEQARIRAGLAKNPQQTVLDMERALAATDKFYVERRHLR